MNFKKVFSLFKINKYFILFFIACAIAGYFKDAALFFLFIFLHDLCHAAAAYFYGLKVKGIELFPFGGVAKIGDLEYIGTLREVVVSAAGPLFNMVSAAFLLLLNKLKVEIPNFDTLLNINILLAAFNLLPGLPLDGGRILRAVLNYYIGFRKASKTAIISGKIISAVLLLTGFLMFMYGKINISFFIMPFFMLYAVGQEESTIALMIMSDMISKKVCLKVTGIMRSKLLCIYEDIYAGDVLKHVDLGRYHIIFVIDSNMKVAGMLTESQIIENLGVGDADITIGQLNCKINGK